MTPSWRKPAGALALLGLILIWVVAIASLAGAISGWPMLAQMLFYALTGVIWIAPIKPLLRWMETGRFRAR